MDLALIPRAPLQLRTPSPLQPPTSPPKRAVQGCVLRPFASCLSYITCEAEECWLSSAETVEIWVT